MRTSVLFGSFIASVVFNCCASSGSSTYGYICLDDLATVNQIDRLAMAGVKTFVVDLPGTEHYTQTLNDMAQAGRVPNQNGANGDSYYAVSASNSQQDLNDVFSSITAQLAKTCDIELPTTPTLLSSQLIVAIDCSPIPLVPYTTPDTGGADGFYIDYSQTPAHLRLTGSHCQTVQAVGARSIGVVYVCGGIN